MKKYYIISLLLLGGIYACKTAKVSTNTTMPEAKVPQQFTQAVTDTQSVATISWKTYFDDPLLVQLIEQGIANNLDLEMALQRIEMARGQVKRTKGALLPQVGLNLGGAVRKYGLYTMDGAGNITTDIVKGKKIPIHLPDMYVGLQSTWEVDIWGKLRNQRNSAVASYLSSVEGSNFIVSNLVADIAIGYYELLALDNELEMVQKTLKNQEQGLAVVKLQKESGRANELAVHQFSALILYSEILEKEISQQIYQTETYINYLLGRYPQVIERNKTLLFEPISQSLKEGVPSQLLQNRPDIRQAAFELQATKFDIQVAKTALYPNLVLTGGLGFQAFNSSYLFMSPSSIAYSAVGNLVAPLINRNALKAQLNIANANQLTAVANYQKTILNAYVEVVNELSNIENLEEINVLRKEQSKLLDESVEISGQLYMAGQATYLEVLVTQQNALEARMDMIIANMRQRVAMVKVYKALGGGWK